MCKKKRSILVTCAFPYSNGPIHLGHLLEHIQADIWVRYQRMQNNDVYFICADDAHGTPVMLKAKNLGISPEEMIKTINIEHKRDLSNFNISYDHYYSTHSRENQVLSNFIYKKLKRNGLISSKEVFQFFDIKENIFLPDRFIKGTCPNCYSIEQYGDNCEICSSVYQSIELINPKSCISGTIPIIKKSEHFFLNLPIIQKKLYNWINSGVLQNQIVNKINEWFKFGLKQWNISRDFPYFGFQIPNFKKKYFYVWFDAIIGYMSVFKSLCKKRNDIKFNDFWNINSKSEVFHFIGKDVIYFHGLFWPAILEGINFRKPTNIFVHGYLKINGKKISKSRNIFVKASTYLSYLESDCLRYYYASKLSSNVEDINIDCTEFFFRINNDIVNKVVNLAARSASFIEKHFNGKLSSYVNDENLHKIFISSSKFIEEFYENRKTNLVIKEVMILANMANSYITRNEPWNLLIRGESLQKLHIISSTGIELFRILMIYLKPILPDLSKKVEKFLNISLNWNLLKLPIHNHCISIPFKNLFSRIRKSDINSVFNNLYK